MLNASPNLRRQIAGDPALHPRHGGRNSPIASAVVTPAHSDGYVHAWRGANTKFVLDGIVFYPRETA